MSDMKKETIDEEEFFTSKENDLLETSISYRELMLKSMFVVKDEKGNEIIMAPDVKDFRVAKEVMESLDNLLISKAKIRASSKKVETEKDVAMATIEIIKQNALNMEQLPEQSRRLALPDSVFFDIKPSELITDVEPLEVNDFIRDDKED